MRAVGHLNHKTLATATKLQTTGHEINLPYSILKIISRFITIVQVMRAPVIKPLELQITQIAKDNKLCQLLNPFVILDKMPLFVIL